MAGQAWQGNLVKRVNGGRFRALSRYKIQISGLGLIDHAKRNHTWHLDIRDDDLASALERSDVRTRLHRGKGLMNAVPDVLAQLP